MQVVVASYVRHAALVCLTHLLFVLTDY
ncbi:protein of unknown function [Pararobbsia alpina]